MKLAEARVMIVDDEPALREIFAKWLRKAGFLNLRTAANGAEAFEAIHREPIDVLVTDVRMPVMDGITLVRKLYEQGNRIFTVILASGFGEVDCREMYDLGVEGFLAKPFRLEDFAEAIEKAIADQEHLWMAPMKLAPRQNLRVVYREQAHGAATDSPLPLSVGRGGFSVRLEEPLSPGPVNFHFEFPTDRTEGESRPDLRGQGYVRWYSRLDHAVGVEFAFLDSPGREWVVQRIAEENPRAYIPALKAGCGSQ